MSKQIVLTLITGLVCALSANAQALETTGMGDLSIPELDCVIEPSDIVDIGSAVPGVVEKIHADRSDLVEAGTVLIELESSVEKAAHDLARARSVLNTAIKLREENASFGALTQTRNQKLMKTSAISRHNMDQLETETKIARLQVIQEKDNKRIAGLESLRTRALLDRRTIRSPVNGVVVERFKSIGEYIDEEPALRIAKLDPLHVEVIVPVSYLGKITPGMQANVNPTAGNREKHMATVERVDRVADAASGTFGVRLVLPNPDYAVTAGLRCLVNFLPGEKIIPVTNDARVAKTDQFIRTNTKPIPEVVSVPEKNVKVARTNHVVQTDKTPIPVVAPAPEKQVEQVNQDSGAFLKVSSQKPDACYSIGPIKDQQIAKGLVKELNGTSRKSNLRDEDVLVTKDYVVMTPVVKTQDEIDYVLQQLKAAGLSDHYVFPKGRYKNRISVGTYYYKQSAVKRLELMASFGVETKIVKRKKKAKHFWLDVTLQPGADNSESLEAVRKSYAPSAPLKQMSCS